jgi:hypothetical protein
MMYVLQLSTFSLEFVVSYSLQGIGRFYLGISKECNGMNAGRDRVNCLLSEPKSKSLNPVGLGNPSLALCEHRAR